MFEGGRALVSSWAPFMFWVNLRGGQLRHEGEEEKGRGE